MKIWSKINKKVGVNQCYKNWKTREKFTKIKVPIALGLNLAGTWVFDIKSDVDYHFGVKSKILPKINDFTWISQLAPITQLNKQWGRWSSIKNSKSHINKSFSIKKIRI